MNFQRLTSNGTSAYPMYSGSKACDQTSAYGSNKFLKIKFYLKKRITEIGQWVREIIEFNIVTLSWDTLYNQNLNQNSLNLELILIKIINIFSPCNSYQGFLRR